MNETAASRGSTGSGSACGLAFNKFYYFYPQNKPVETDSAQKDRRRLGVEEKIITGE